MTRRVRAGRRWGRRRVGCARARACRCARRARPTTTCVSGRRPSRHAVAVAPRHRHEERAEGERRAVLLQDRAGQGGRGRRRGAPPPRSRRPSAPAAPPPIALPTSRSRPEPLQRPGLERISSAARAAAPPRACCCCCCCWPCRSFLSFSILCGSGCSAASCELRQGVAERTGARASSTDDRCAKNETRTFAVSFTRDMGVSSSQRHRRARTPLL